MTTDRELINRGILEVAPEGHLQTVDEREQNRQKWLKKIASQVPTTIIIEAADRIAELEEEVRIQTRRLEATQQTSLRRLAQLEAVKDELDNLDRVFSHPDMCGYEAYDLIKSIRRELRRAIGEDK